MTRFILYLGIILLAVNNPRTIVAVFSRNRWKTPNITLVFYPSRVKYVLPFVSKGKILVINGYNKVTIRLQFEMQLSLEETTVANTIEKLVFLLWENPGRFQL